MWAHKACDEVITQARTRDAASGALALGQFVTGRPCHVALGGVYLRRCDDNETPVLDSAGNPLPVAGVVFPDPSLAVLGIEAVRLPGGPSMALDRRARVGAVLWRIGVLLKMLDTAFAHLSTRESGGQKTLQHQLVKATFTECFSLAEQLRLEAPHWLGAAEVPDLSDPHARLTAATCKAAKLMGGHGYLRGSLNSLECLSLCVSSLTNAAVQAQSRAAA
ncbi:acyl-CoA dehydrogenase family protein [Tropicibacter oceani]|uniref:Acyl-CoA dehydrogenase/oxidase C-terminal domain-containing protein n=1 Tax=Tropicibacter oceani TaxID=3058420 RepID=A0ABY8QIP3_9RHOB|nr:hypothetical protein [Tropicibacter oceani]WGW04526.1 hypothetical protein QF118_02955 [Tropicibacter oceani]